MARYADYVKDKIDDEIADSAANREQRQEDASDGFQIPERFKGKSPEEIARSYVELEKLQSKQAQDLGAMRKTVDDLISLELRRGKEPPEQVEPDEPVTIDDLYADTSGTIQKVASKAVASRIDKLEKQLEETSKDKKLDRFEKLHPDWREIAQSPEFSEWVQGSSFRQRLAYAADQFDFDAANDLFTGYKEAVSKAEKVAKEQDRKQKLRDATLESSSPGVPERTQGLSRQALLNTRVAAAQGDKEARTWLAKNADAITKAYEEGRIVD